MALTETEKRRIQLLDETRERFRDRREIPAVHPRYQAAYHELYDRMYDGADDRAVSTFGIRSFLCVITFIVFLIMNSEQIELLHMSSSDIVDEITTNLDIEALWEKL
jgi:hypothetical protein